MTKKIVKSVVFSCENKFGKCIKNVQTKDISGNIDEGKIFLNQLGYYNILFLKRIEKIVMIFNSSDFENGKLKYASLS